MLNTSHKPHYLIYYYNCFLNCIKLFVAANIVNCHSFFYWGHGVVVVWKWCGSGGVVVWKWWGSGVEVVG